MTTPTERTRAVIQTADFLGRLLYPHLTPRVPKAVREEARALLRHYPTVYDMGRLGEVFDPTAPLPAPPARGLPACGAERERGGED